MKRLAVLLTVVFLSAFTFTFAQGAGKGGGAGQGQGGGAGQSQSGPRQGGGEQVRDQIRDPDQTRNPDCPFVTSDSADQAQNQGQAQAQGQNTLRPRDGSCRIDGSSPTCPFAPNARPRDGSGRVNNAGRGRGTQQCLRNPSLGTTP